MVKVYHEEGEAGMMSVAISKFSRHAMLCVSDVNTSFTKFIKMYYTLVSRFIIL